MSNKIEFLLVQASNILVSAAPNYAKLHAITQDIEKKVHKVSGDALIKVSAYLQSYKDVLATHKDALKVHLDWQTLGFPPEFIETHPDCVDFLIKSGVAYQIACYRNSPSLHADKHTVRPSDDGHPMILVEGTMTRWEDIKGKLVSYKEYDILRSAQAPNEFWTYISPLGITRQNIFRFSQPFCVDELSQEYVKKVQEYAKGFYTEQNPDPTPDVQKPYVLQICTSTGVLFRDRNVFIRGLFKKLATHYGIRIITPEGKVYSFGYRRDVGERAYVRTSTALGQVLGRVALNDFEESKPHDGRYITTLPLSEEAFRKAIQDVVDLNCSQPSFDWLHANCIKITMRQLSFAGVDVQTETRLETCIKDVVNAVVKNIPTFGSPIIKIKKVAKQIFSYIPALPLPIKKVRDIVLYIPAKIGAIAKYLLVWAVGWTTVSPSLACVRESRKFSLWDALNQDYSNVHYPRKLLSWQKRQATTHCHTYTGVPAFVILPPTE